MSTLIIDTVDGVAARSTSVEGYLADADGNAVTGYHADGTIVRPWRARTDATGHLEIDVTPNADITPTGTVWAVYTADRKHVITKGAGTETLEEALAATPENLGGLVALGALTNVDPDVDAAEDLQLLRYDATAEQWAPVRLTDLRTSRLYAYGHSLGRLGKTEDPYLFQHRLAAQLHAKLWDRHVSSSKMLSIGAVAGGLATSLQIDRPPARAYGAQQYLPRIGVPSLLSWINDVQTWATADDWPELLVALVECGRSWLAWQWASTFFAHDDPGTGQAFGGANWTTPTYTVGLEPGPGDGYASNVNAGRTITITTSANAAGRYHDLWFLTNTVGGGVASGPVTITLDDDDYDPAEGPLNTNGINPASVGLPGCAVRRVEIPDDDDTHTIVVTSGTGGVAYAGYSIEAPRLALFWNVPRRGSDDGYTPNGSGAIVAELNEAFADLVAEFGAPAVLVDIDTAIDAADTLYADDLHWNDGGAERATRAARDATVTVALSATERGMV